MKWLFLLPVVGFTGIVSCKSVVKSIYGLHDFKVEDSASIMKYARSKFTVTDNILSVDSQSYKMQVLSINKKLPYLKIYDSEGRRIKIPVSSSTCQTQFEDVILSLNSNGHYDVDSETLADNFSGFRDLNGRPVQLQTVGNPDYYILLYWSKAIGSYNKSNIDKWETAARKQPGVRLSLYKINMDIQSYWGK